MNKCGNLRETRCSRFRQATDITIGDVASCSGRFGQGRMYCPELSLEIELQLRSPFPCNTICEK